MRPAFLIFTSLCLSACSLPTYDEAQQSAEHQLQKAYAAQSDQSSGSSHVIREQGYFVPPLVATPSGPDWHSEHADFVFEQYPLELALREMLRPHSVSVRLLDDIDAEKLISLRHSGTLGVALAQLGLITGLHFESTDQLVTVRQFEMAEFDVAFLAGSTSFFLGDDKKNIQGQSSSAPGMPVSSLSDDTEQYLNFTSDTLSVWEDLKAALQLLLSADGTIALNQSSTSVLVRDYPQHVAQIRNYLLEQNERLTRQVAVDVQVIDVTFSDQQQVGIDWELVYQSASHSGILNFASGRGAAPGRDPSQISLQRSSGPFAGSTALIEALSQQGVVEVSSHPRLVSLNNQISRIVLEDNSTYLASAGTSSTANVGSNDLLIPGVVTTGFELYLLPKVANSQVIMQLSTSLSDLKAIDQVTSGETTIQTPHTNRKKFFMKAMVADGETLLISGLKSTRQKWQQQRTLSSWLFGGRRQQNRQHAETVLLLTPRILGTGAVL